MIAQCDGWCVGGKSLTVWKKRYIHKNVKMYWGRKYEFYIGVDVIKSNQYIELENVTSYALPYEFFINIMIFKKIISKSHL